jgi:hypothetical protein
MNKESFENDGEKVGKMLNGLIKSLTIRIDGLKFYDSP